MSNDSDQFQLMDGPEEHPGIHSREQLLQLIASGQVPPWARILDLQNLQSCSAADLGQPLSVATAGTSSDYQQSPSKDTSEQSPQTQVPHAQTAQMPSQPQLHVRADATSASDSTPDDDCLSSVSDEAHAAYQNSTTNTVIADPKPGTQWGDYRFEQKIGQGGMGTVYKAVKVSTQEAVAIKVLPQELGLDESLVKRFHREAEALAMIDSPYVSRVIENGQQGNRHFFVMEYVEGTTLSQVIRESSTIPPNKAATIISQCCKGLWAAAKHGIVHRDIKPSNIIIASDGTTRLLDFGLVLLTRDESDLTKLTQTGLVIGTVRYLSPEQARGENCDHRSDIYAIGIVLFEMLTGQLPYPADDVPSMLQHHLHTHAPRPSSIRPEIPSRMDRTVLRCLNKDPNGRYHSSMDLVRELENPETIRSDRRTSNRGQVSNDLAQSPSKQSYRGLLTALFFVLIVVGAGGVGGWYYLQQQHVEPQTTPTSPLVAVTTEPLPEEKIVAESHKQTAASNHSVAFDINTLLRNYHIAQDNKDWQEMWRHGRAIIKRFPRRAQDARIEIPLMISGAQGTRIYRDFEYIGDVPLTIHCKPQETGLISAIRPQAIPQLRQLDSLLVQNHIWDIPAIAASDIHSVDMLPGPTSGSLSLIKHNEGGVGTGNGFYFFIDGPGVYSSLALPQIKGSQLGHTLRHGQHLYILHRNQLTVVGHRDQRIHWRLAPPAGSHFIHGLFIGEHELVPGSKKIHLLTDRQQAVSVVQDRRGLTPLKATNLGNYASAAPSHIVTATGAATLLIPSATQALLFDSATGTQQHVMQALSPFDPFTQLQITATPYYHGADPLFLLADQGKQLVAIHAAGDVDPLQRQWAHWPLPAAPALPAVVDAYGTTAYVALDGGDIIAIDIRQPGGTLWRYNNYGASQVSGWSIGNTSIYCAYFDGSIHLINKKSGKLQHLFETKCQLNAGIAVFDRELMVTTKDGVLLSCLLPSNLSN